MGKYLADPQSGANLCISLGDGNDCANSVGVRWSSSLLPYLCPLCPVGGGGYVGFGFGKPLKRAIRKAPGLQGDTYPPPPKKRNEILAHRTTSSQNPPR